MELKFVFYLEATTTASELSYYVNDGVLKTIGKDYVFQELVNPIYNRKDNQVLVSLAVKLAMYFSTYNCLVFLPDN